MNNHASPATQSAQKCPWCFDWLLYGQETAIYNGKDPLYNGWFVHKNCNLKKNSTDDESDYSDDSMLTTIDEDGGYNEESSDEDQKLH